MEWVLDIKWDTVLMPETSPLEIFIRGSLIFISLFILLRIILKRQAGGLSITDFLVVVLIADAAQNGMADDYRSIPDGILLVATIIFWNFVFEWLGYHWPWFEKLVHPAPLPLVKNGKILTHNMRSELVTREELMTQLRLHGIEDLSKIKRAQMEGDGKISFIKKR